MTTMNGNRATTLRRGIQLLEHLSTVTDGEGVAAAELSRSLGIERSVVHRTLQVLHELELVDKDPVTLNFRPGWRLFTLAAGLASQRLMALAPDFLERLSSSSGEAAYLSVRERDRVLTVLSTPSSNVVQAVNRTGAASPLTCTSAGRALLVDHDKPALERLCGLGPYECPTPASPRNLNELVSRLEAARASGVVVADEEFEIGLIGLGAPVRDFRRNVVAAVNISGPAHRMRPRLDELVALLSEESALLSAQLGFVGSAQTPKAAVGKAANRR
jgi:IclR family transcriptional regulator, KDG regulon repressor